MSSSAEKPNRLIREKSPYLLQHAYNPVDWYPWGEEAFRNARESNRPIFLSIGYATCHWCHVMEAESFENHETAALLNDSFIPVKVDREEHPDLDRLYMAYVQTATGRGGWPMSVWLTPDLQPFYGGSYFPPDDRYGMPGFSSVLRSIARVWNTDSNRIKQDAAEFFKHLENRIDAPRSRHALDGDTAQQSCFDWLLALYDSRWGGFGQAPKFPRPAILTFLFSHAFHTGDRKASGMALHTLEQMARGGIRDHIRSIGNGGGGFARYSTDARWHLPHFEKMLYDNAQLARSYIDAFLISGNRLFADVARDIFNYVLHDLRSPEGGFYSAEDADSLPEENSRKKREGAFYVWEWDEIRTIAADPPDIDLFVRTYGIRPEGNVTDDPHGEFSGKNVLIQVMEPEEAARLAGTDPDRAIEMLDRMREKLYRHRSRRPRPLCDDKIITSWNGLMISALAWGYRVLGEQEYLDAARKAAYFIRERLFNEKEEILLRRYRDGEGAIAGKAEDYACFIRGLLDLYQACFDDEMLSMAIRLCRKQNELFYDRDIGGYFSTALNDRSVPVRLKEEYDGAEPAATSVSVKNLLDIALATGDMTFSRLAEECFREFSDMLIEQGNALPLMLAALNHAQKRGILATLTGPRESPELRNLQRTLDSFYIPDLMVIHVAPVDEQHSAEYNAETQNTPTVSISLCVNNTCMHPVTSPDALRMQLDAIISR